jgi:hypothetical protein
MTRHQFFKAVLGCATAATVGGSSAKTEKRGLAYIRQHLPETRRAIAELNERMDRLKEALARP